MFATTNKNEVPVKRTNDSKIDTLIGVSTSMEGNISSDGNIRIDGTFKGDINTKKQVNIGENGHIIGNITAYNIVISGKVEGNIKCDGLLEILPSGKLHGDIEVINISIKEGAIFKGSSCMKETDKKDESFIL
ncbi:MAG: polymer-forming cytoskeletal protein, partial [Clostridiaceae bacterium]